MPRKQQSGILTGGARTASGSVQRSSNVPDLTIMGSHLLGVPVAGAPLTLMAPNQNTIGR
jgi:hypothetical protein